MYTTGFVLKSWQNLSLRLAYHKTYFFTAILGRWWYLWQILREKCAVWYLHNRLPHFRGNFVGCAWNTKYFLYKPRRVLLAPNPSHLASKYLFVYCHFPTCLGPKKLCIKYMSRGKRSPQNQWESQPLSTFKITKDLDFVWSI